MATEPTHTDDDTTYRTYVEAAHPDTPLPHGTPVAVIDLADYTVRRGAIASHHYGDNLEDTITVTIPEPLGRTDQDPDLALPCDTLHFFPSCRLQETDGGMMFGGTLLLTEDEYRKARNVLIGA